MTPSFPFAAFFMCNLFISSLLAISSNSWLGVWTSLEFNLISFLPLMMVNPSATATESAVKYFIVQAMSSALLLFFYLMVNTFYNEPMFNWIMVLSLSIKLGLAPFHQWVPSVTSALSWTNLFLLLTWQKLAPLAIMSQFIYSYNSKFMTVIASFSALIGGLGGLNQTQMRTILAFSSIGHMGWATTSLMISTFNTITYLLTYAFTLAAIIMLLTSSEMSTLTKSFNLMLMPPFLATLLFILLLSLGGLPPFLGFMPKAMVLNSMITSYMVYQAVPLVMGSLMNLYYYLSFIMVYLYSPSTKNKMSTMSLTWSTSYILMIPIFGMPIMLPLI